MADPLIRYRDTNREDPRDQGFNNNLGNNAGGVGGDRLAPSPGARSQNAGRGAAQASPPRPRTPPSDPEAPFWETHAEKLKYGFLVLLGLLLLYILNKGLQYFVSSRSSDGIQKSCIGKCLKNWEENNRLKATVQPSPESTPDVSGITANIQPWLDPDRRWSRADFLRDSQREIDSHITKDRKQTLGLGSQGSKNLLPAEDPEFWNNFGQRLSDLATSTKSLNQNKNQLSTSLLNKEYDRTYQALQAEKKLIDTLRKDIEELLGLDDSPERTRIENDVTRIRDQIEELNRNNPSAPLEIEYKQAREKSDTERANLQKKNSALANL